MKRLGVIAALVALGGCAHAPAPGPQPMALDALLAFADPARCEPGPHQAKLLGEMIAGDANAGFRAGRIVLGQPYSRAFGPIRVEPHDGYTAISVSVRGSLFGLPITALVQSLPEGGDPGETHYRFKAAPETVERVLASRGFPVKLGHTVPIGPPDGYEHFIELVADPVHPGHVLLSCGYQ
jgi:hypothetical protein